jgi:hypothetical protein
LASSVCEDATASGEQVAADNVVDRAAVGARLVTLDVPGRLLRRPPRATGAPHVRGAPGRQLVTQNGSVTISPLPSLRSCSVRESADHAHAQLDTFTPELFGNPRRVL